MNFLKKMSYALGFAISKRVDSSTVRVLLDEFRPSQISQNLIRVGGSSDGGYLIPNDLESIDAVFSPGVAETADFEAFFIHRGVPTYMVDASVEESPLRSELAFFERLWLAESSVPGFSITLEEWVNQKSGSQKNLILQMDIEGAEYGCLLATDSSVLERFRIIVLELHDLHSMCSRMGIRTVSALIRHLKKTHVIVHTHVNNGDQGLILSGLRIPDLLELTLYRKDRAILTGEFAQLPNALDRPNTQNSDWSMNW